MQWDRHIPGKTEIYSAIEVKQPLADEIASGRLDSLVLKRGTSYRGPLLIVSAPTSYVTRGGMIVGRAELVSVEKKGREYEYRFEKMERMIEFPCQKCGAKGVVWTVFYTADTLMEYPKIRLNVK